MPNDRGPMVLINSQSNGIIPGNTGPAPYTPTAKVQIWTDTDGDGVGDAFHYMQPGVNTGTLKNPTAWGPEVGLANEWLKGDHPDDEYLWLGKAGQGETGMVFDPDARDLSPRSDGELFDFAVLQARNMQANLGYDHLDLLILHQGETDAYSASKAAAYKPALLEYVDAARAEMRVQDIVIGRINDTAPYSQAVREAQWQVDQGDDHIVSFKTIGFGLQADRIHHDATGAIQLGTSDYEAWGML